MIEILVIWYLAKRVGAIVEEKGHKSGWYKVLLVVLWFGGEIVGAVIGVLLAGDSDSGMCVIYPFALVGAMVGAGITFLIANSLSPEDSSLMLATQTKTCPRCAEKIQPEAAVCRYCGHEFAEEEVTAARQLAESQAEEQLWETKKSRHTAVGWILTVVGGVLLAIGVLFLIVFTLGQFASSSPIWETAGYYLITMAMCPLPIMIVGGVMFFFGIRSLRQVREMKERESFNSQ